MTGSAPSAPASPPSAGELRTLWDSGQRGPAIRGALQSWERLSASGDDLDWLQQALRACGLAAEALALQAHATRQRGGTNALESLIRSVLQGGDPAWARQLLAEAASTSRELRALAIETVLDSGEAAELISAWLRDYRDEAALEAAVDWWVRAGRVEEAERILQEHTGLDLWRARLALWRKEPQVARESLSRLPPSPAVACLHAIAMALEGRLDEAEESLMALRDGEVAAQARTWLATVLRLQGRYAEAVEAADAAALVSPVFNLANRLERDLADAHARAALHSWGPWRARLPRIKRMELAPVLYLLGLQPNDRMGELERVLQRFGGNHTAHPTTVEQGRLTSCRLPPDPRHLGASVQRVLWTRGADAARALYQELGPTVGDHPLFHIYHGEIELWMGAYQQAERIFREVLARDKRVRWAWIGLGASVMFQGDLRAAQRLWARGLALTRCAGPTLYVYRGECYRRQGEAVLARKDLETALREKPGRLSARINLALLEQEPAALQRAEHECRAFAPLLMEDLTGNVAERLEKVLLLMRGNRSSSEWHMSYHLWGHLWRRGV